MGADRRPGYPGDFAVTTPDKPAVIMAGSGQVVTFAQLDDESTRLARVLRAAGLGVGDRVAILMGNDPRFLTVAWACRRIGLYYIPLNWHLTAAEMQYIVANAGATGIVADGLCAEQAGVLRRENSALRVAVAVGSPIEGFDDFDAAIAGVPGGPLEDETEGADIVYTSGTTGRPKGGMKPLSGRHPGDEDVSGIGPILTACGVDAETRYLTPGAPLYHAAPLRFSIAVTRRGATCVVMERFDAEQALATIERHRVTVSQWVPTMFVRMLKLPVEVRTRYDLSSHHTAIHAAAPCPVAVKEQMIEWWGPILFEYYGASEGGGGTAIGSRDWLEHRGSVGKPVGCTVHICDEDGNELPSGQPGLIYTEGGLPVEYLGDPEKTKSAYNKQGWVTVGDVGYLDEEGYLYLTDRKDYVIISGGVNIYPQEAEDILVQHPKVADVAVIGVPNEEFGEEVKAVVELFDADTANEATAAELLQYCRDRLAHYKCPKSVDFVDTLPRSPAGKLYKRRLRDRYWGDRPSLT